MAREAPRSLHTLSPRYQRGVNSADYEVLAVDSGSNPPLPQSVAEYCSPNCRILRMGGAPSPAASINAAVRAAQGEAVMILIDGARMLSPGIIRYALAAIRMFDDPVVATLAWHLGPKIQNESMLEGYCQEVEDRLLDSVDWRGDGYELFRIATLAGSSQNGWFRPIAESNCVTVRRETWLRLGGLHEGFISPGGGWVNLDFYREACVQLDPLVILLGEGTFHQFHGGVATNVPWKNHPNNGVFNLEYERIRGRKFSMAEKAAIHLGSVPAQALEILQYSATKVQKEREIN